MQVIPLRLPSISTGTLWLPLCSPSSTGWQNSNEADWASHYWTTNGVMSALRIELPVAPGAGTSHTFLMRRKVSGGAFADTAVSVTISDTNTSGTWTGSLSMSDTDEVSFRHTASGSPAATTPFATFEFEPTNQKQSQYGGGSWNSRNSLTVAGTLSTTSGGSIFASNNNAAAIAAWQNVMAFDGAITAARFGIDTAKGVNVTFTAYKNGVAQDGTGGTPNITVTVTAGQVHSPLTTFTCNFLRGDVIYWLRNSDAAGGCGLRMGVTITASENGMYMIAGGNETNQPSAAAASFSAPSGVSASGWTTTEAAVQAIAGPSGMALRTLNVVIGTAPGASKQFAYAVRNTGVDTNLTTTISGSSQVTANETRNAIFAAYEKFSFGATPTGTPTQGSINWTIGSRGSGGGGGGGNRGNAGPKGPGGKTLFGTTGMLFWDSINGFGQ